MTWLMYSPVVQRNLLLFIKLNINESIHFISIIISQDYFNLLREKFPILKIAILNVRAKVETVLKRAAKRADVTGRIVPDSVCMHSTYVYMHVCTVYMYVCIYVCLKCIDVNFKIFKYIRLHVWMNIWLMYFEYICGCMYLCVHLYFMYMYSMYIPTFSICMFL